MAAADPNFQEETENIHREHEELVAHLDQLDAALEQIVCYSQIFTDLATANQATANGNWMAAWLPQHHGYEETTVLETIARMSPELASFAREMKRQHHEMRLRLELFRDHLARLSETRDLETALAGLKGEGKELTRMIRLHLAAEDKKLSGLEH